MAADNNSSNFFLFLHQHILTSNCSNFSDNNCSSSENPPDLNLTAGQIIAVVITSVIVLLGVPANVAVIVKLSRHLRGSSMTQRLFFNLAASDLLCLLCLPAVIAVFYIGPDLPHEGICELVSFLIRFCISCDRNILALISIQRYYQVLHHKKWDKVGQKWQQLLFFTVWMLGALIALPVVFLIEVTEINDGHADEHSCRNRRVNPVFEMVYVMFVAFSYLVLFFFYLLLVRGVRRTQIPNSKEPRVTKLFIRIITVSLLAGLVPLICRMLIIVANLSYSEELQHISKKVKFLRLLYFLNHCLNPFLYFFASRQSRTDGNHRGCLSMCHNGNS